MRSRQTVYASILNRSFWVRALKRGPETGHTLIYRPVRGIAKPCEEKDRSRLRDMRAEFQEMLGLAQAPPVVIPRLGEDVAQLIENALRHGPRPDLAVFEGYTLNSGRECRDRDARLAEVFRKYDVPVALAAPEASDCWNGKPYFRQRVKKILGEGAVVPGRVFEKEDSTGLSSYVAEIFARGIRRAVLKVHGGGGGGNCLLEPDQDYATRIGRLLKNPPDPSSSWALVEVWRHWEHTFCCSYFIADESTPPIPLETCEQLFAPDSSGVVARKSFTDVSAKDLGIVQGALLGVVRAMQEDGIRGFTAIDVILAEPRQTDVLVLPDSGLAVLTIEANVRINGHNQERLFAGYLAHRDGLDADDVLHLRVANKPVPSAEDRAGSKAFFVSCLEGLAEPLTPQPMKPGQVYFVLDDNDGKRSSFYDGILFVARRESGAEEALIKAKDCLWAEGYLKS